MPASAKTELLLNAAWLEMRENRKTGGKGRAIVRGWKYGEGKQIALKAGVGVAIGVVFTGVSVATAGAALPVVIAIAAGGFTAGQAANASFSILKNRGKMRGLGSTANWVDSVRGKTMQEQQEHVRALDTRAYKTIRRSYEHFREAARKSLEAEKTRVALFSGSKLFSVNWITCGDAIDLLSASLSVSHHLHKARLYLEPAIHIERVVLFALQAWIAEWRAAETKLETAIDAFFKQNHDSCGADCYNKYTAAKQKRNRPEEVELWSDALIQGYDDELSDLFDKLAVASVLPQPKPKNHGALPRIRRMLDDAHLMWSVRRTSAGIKIKHFVTNTFARKTTAERVAFGIGQTVGALAATGSTAGGAAVDGSVQALVKAGYAGLDTGLAFSSTAVDSARDFFGGMVIDVVADRVAPTPDLDDETDLKHHKGSTAAATKNREFLRKAAQHIYEADERKKRIDELGSVTLTKCAEAREFAAHVFAVNHHIGKAQQYLWEAITLTTETGTQVWQASQDWSAKFNSVYQFASDRVSDSDHRSCTGGVCYGPTPGRPDEPIQPLI